MELEKLQHSYLRVRETIGITWKVFILNWKNFLTFILLIVIPVKIISMAPYNYLSGILLFPFMIFGALLIASFFATIIITEYTIKKKTINLKNIISQTFEKLLSLLIVNLKTKLITIIGFSLLIIPGIYFSINYIFINQVIMLRIFQLNACDLNSNDYPIYYSASLVKPNWWRVFRSILSLGIVFMIILFLVTFPIALLDLILDPILYNHFIISNFLFDILIILVVYPFMISLTILFLNLEYLEDKKQ